jgi:hypothetical protein
MQYPTGFFCACARYAIVGTYRRQLQVNSSELTLCSAGMAVRSGQALTSTILCITSPTSSTTQLYPTSSRASGVSKTMLNRSKAHHQSSTNPGHDSSSVAFQEVRFGRPRVAFSRNTRTKTALDVWQLHAFPVALRSHIHFLCARLVKATLQFDGLRSQGVRTTPNPNFGSVTTQMTRWLQL